MAIFPKVIGGLLAATAVLIAALILFVEPAPVEPALKPSFIAIDERVYPTLPVAWGMDENDIGDRLRLRENAFGGYDFDPATMFAGGRKGTLYFNAPGGGLDEIYIEGRTTGGGSLTLFMSRMAVSFTARCGEANINPAGRIAAEPNTPSYFWKSETCFIWLKPENGKWVLQMKAP